MSAAPYAGKLRHRVTFLQPVAAADGMGGASTVWQTYAQRWAYVEAVAAANLEAGDARHSPVAYSVLVRRDDALSAAMRCVYNAKTCRILWVKPRANDAGFTECRIQSGGVL